MFTVCTGGSLFFYHVRGVVKNCENRNVSVSVFAVFSGGSPMFFYHPRGKNGKERNVLPSFLDHPSERVVYISYHMRGAISTCCIRCFPMFV